MQGGEWREGKGKEIERTDRWSKTVREFKLEKG